MPLQRYLKFSLRTLLLITLCIASSMLLHHTWSPWRLEKTIDPALPPSSNPFAKTFAGRVFFFDNDRYIATNGTNGLGVWDLEKNSWVVKRPESAGFVFNLHGTERPLVFWEERPHFVVHDLLKNEALITLNEYPTNSVQTRDGSLVALRLPAEDKYATEVWDRVQKKKLWTTEGAEWLVFSDDSTLAADVDKRNNAVRIYDAQTGVVRHNIPITEAAGLHAALFTPDGAILLALEMGSTEASALIALNPVDGTLRSKWHLLARIDSAPAFSPDSQRIATHESDGSIRVWQIATGRQICSFPVLNGSNREAFTFFPDGQRILLAHSTGDASIFNAETGKQLLKLFHGQPWTPGINRDAYFDTFGLSAKGDRIACLTNSGHIQLWKRICPEYWWGPAHLPEFWLTFLLGVALLVSLIRDFRRLA